jgi:hypothetical protein
MPRSKHFAIPTDKVLENWQTGEIIMKNSRLYLCLGGALTLLSACKPTNFSGSAQGNLASGSKGVGGQAGSTGSNQYPDGTSAGGANPGQGNSGANGGKQGTTAIDPVTGKPVTGAQAEATAAELAILCSTPSATHPLVAAEEFPLPSKSCAWGSGTGSTAGNLSQKDGRISARFEEARSLAIPKGAFLCRMAISFVGAGGSTNQNMYYDDEIFVLFDNLIIASSKDYGTRFPALNGFQVYDWTKLVGTEYSQLGAGPYCVGGAGTCGIPKTQTNGVMTLTVSDKIVQKLATTSGMIFEGQKIQTAKPTEHSIGFVTIGDNDDPIDCKHSPLGFNVHAEYVIPK